MRVLSGVRYPGRFIVLGTDDGSAVALYGVTGRSAASQARRYVRRGGSIAATPTDEAVMADGNRDLLVYPAFVFFEKGFIVANGTHITNVSTLYGTARQTLEKNLVGELPEPDTYFTSRITGCVADDGTMALHSVRGTTEHPKRASWSVEVVAGKGTYLATYDGDEVNPGQFGGDPLDVELVYGSAEAAAHAVYDLLAPPAGAPDYRVAVIAVYRPEGGAPQVVIKNRFG